MVLTVTAILATVGINSFVTFSEDAKKAVTQEKLNALKAAIIGDPRFVDAGKYLKLGYESQCGGLPSSLTDLITMPAAGTCSTVYDPFLKTGWRGPYVNSSDPNWNLDGWGITIEYFSSGPPARTLRSCGPDKTCGTADDISVTF